MDCENTVITKKGEKGDKGDKGSTGDSIAPLVWNDLTDYLRVNWEQTGDKLGEFAFEPIQKLLYLRGNIQNLTSAPDTIAFAIPEALVGGAVGVAFNVIGVEKNNSVIEIFTVGEVVVDTLSLVYNGVQTQAVICLDSILVIKL